MAEPLRVVLLAACQAQSRLIADELKSAGFDLRLEQSDSVAEMTARLEPPPDVIITDDSMPRYTALRALHVLRERALNVPVIVVATAGSGPMEPFLQAGAADFVYKDRLERLGPAIQQARALKRLADENRGNESQLRLRARLDGLSAALGVALAEDGALDDTLRKCVTAMAREVHAASVGIWSVNHSNGTLELRAGAGLPTSPDESEGRISVEPSAIGWIARERKSYATNDVYADPVFTDKNWAQRRGIVAFAGVPLVVGERLVGILALCAKHPLAPVEVDFLAAAANQLAVAIDSRHASEALERSETRFQQVQKMEAVGRLAGGVAHDFNNLLTIICGYAEMVKEKTPATEPAHELITQIMHAGERATALTRQLLTFSRRQVREVESLDLNAVLRDTVRMLKRLIGEDIEISLELAPALRTILADAGQVNQIIMNLAINARDAMPGGGQLSFATANVDLEANQIAGRRDIEPGRFVMLQVTDTGAGMDDATKQRIFEPFFTTKDLGKGTGLGLATVQSAVEQNGGFFEVDSEVGQGSAFRIYLPEGKKAPAKSKPTAGAHDGDGETILLVEDDDAVRHFAVQVLEARGYQLLEAANGAEALALGFAHRGEIPLVITDVIMPHMSGRVLADQLVATRPHTSVLFMSGYTGEALAQHRVSETGTLFLQKPFTAASLAGKVREILRREIKA